VQLRFHGDKGQPIPAGEVGGIAINGPNVFKGYWRMPEKTAGEFTTDLGFKTGEVGKVDAQGVVSIVGRSKDLIISGAYNVSPAEIEPSIATDRCPRCGGGLRCGMNDPGSCACTTVTLDPALLRQLPQSWLGCLCLDCLRALAGGAAR
jgi:acyl-CoA synthetase (AMP-forming)/AMP-acid ligase II